VRSGIDCNQSEARNRLSSSWGALERAELGAGLLIYGYARRRPRRVAFLGGLGDVHTRPGMAEAAADVRVADLQGRMDNLENKVRARR
jgi:hypothetical protein